MTLPMLNQQLAEKRVERQDGALEIIDIFPTIQGEGPFAGEPAIFVRLAGCVLQCPLCDTDYTSGRRLISIPSLTEEIDEYTYLNREHAIFPEDGTKFVWSRSDYEVSYNKDGNTEDLENGGGSTYSDYAIELGDTENLIVFEIDDSCGGKYRMIFSKENEVK